MINDQLNPLVVIDIAIFTVQDQQLKILLVKRANEPEKGKWALPGGILIPSKDLNLESSARRILKTKVSVDIAYLEEVCTFSGLHRDPRGWSIATLHYALLPTDKTHALVKESIEDLTWQNVLTCPALAFDHELQLQTALTTLRRKVSSHLLPLHLMRPKFTLSDLQKTCEAILDQKLDKSVFRRRLKNNTDIIELEEYEGGAQRPAQLFKARANFEFKAPTIERD